MPFVTDALADEPILLLAAVLSLGAVLGAVRIRGISIGPAGALFAGLAASAVDDRLVIPGVVGFAGLSLFTYCVGLSAGPGLAVHLRPGLALLGVVTAGLAVLAPVAVLIGNAFGLTRPEIAGAYAGGLTNTPALAAAQELLTPSERGEPVVGYALTYPYGVLGMLAAVLLAERIVRSGPADATAGPLQNVSVVVGARPPTSVRDLEERFVGGVRVSRVQRGERIWVPTEHDALERGDVVAVACPSGLAAAVVRALGDRSPTRLTDDRSRLDFRRMVVSDPHVAGRSLRSLRLTERFGATITRVRRGSTDLLADGKFVLEPGDRVRVVAPPARMSDVAAVLGDDERRVAHFDPVGFTVGLLIGVLVGLVPIPVPGAGTVELGVAGGPLLVGLALGWRERTGPLVWQIPHGVSYTIRQLGALLFLGMAGTSGGAALRSALEAGEGPAIVGAGLVITTSSAVIVLAVGHWRRLGPSATAGLIAGAQTQPAVLAFGAERTADPELDITYALVLPVAMVTKIVAAQLLILI